MVKQSIGQSVRAVMEMHDSGGGKCAESEVKGDKCLVDKENVPGKDEAMVVSVFPIRELRQWSVWLTAVEGAVP